MHELHAYEKSGNPFRERPHDLTKPIIVKAPNDEGSMPILADCPTPGQAKAFIAFLQRECTVHIAPLTVLLDEGRYQLE